MADRVRISHIQTPVGDGGQSEDLPQQTPVGDGGQSKDLPHTDTCGDLPHTDTCGGWGDASSSETSSLREK